MPIKHTGKTPQQMLKALADFKKRATTIAGVEAVNHFKQGFIDGGFTDSGFERWDARKNNTDPGRAVLVGKGAGHLKRAIKILAENAGQNLTVGVDAEEIPYAEIHNQGGTIVIPITPAMRAHFWKMWYGLSGSGKSSKWSAGASNAANFYKAMALTKKQELTVVIPQRKFIGVSKVLDGKIKTKFDLEIEKIFN